MKRTIISFGSHLRAILAFAAASSIVLTSCSSEPEPEPEPEPERVEVIFSSSIASFEQTRVTDAGWNSGDEIGVFMFEAGATLSDESVVDWAVNRNFRTSGDDRFEALNPNHELYFPTDNSKVDFVAYHPYRSDSHVKDYKLDVDVSDQNAEELYLLYSDNLVDRTSADTSNELKFVHKLSRLVLDITIGDDLALMTGMEVSLEGINTTADFSLDAGTFAYTGATGRITLSEGTPAENYDALYEAVLIPTIGPDEARTVVFDIPEVGTYTYDIPVATMFASGKIHHYEVAVTPEGVEVTEGEIESWTGKDDPQETGTADPVIVADPDEELLLLPNSYIVAPGQTLEIPVGKAYAMWRLDPLLKDAGADMSGMVVARKVWEDTKGLVPAADISLSGEGKDAVITVVTGTAYPDGNMVVGLYIDEVIFWSWHVWITPYDPELAASQATNNGFTFMNRNLGAWNSVPNDGQRGMMAGRFYQWGRKDPLFSVNAFMGGAQGVYDNNGNSIYIGSKYGDVSGSGMDNLVWSIQNPISIIRASGATVDWYSAEGEDGAYRWNNPDGSKSVFDPCPEGWRVPTSGEGDSSPWYGISMDDGTWRGGWANGAKGWTFPELGYFPASGYFGYDGMLPSGGIVGTRPHLWTATQSAENGFAYCLKATDTTWEPSSTLPRGSSMPVRCVKDTE